MHFNSDCINVRGVKETLRLNKIDLVPTQSTSLSVGNIDPGLPHVPQRFTYNSIRANVSKPDTVDDKCQKSRQVHIIGLRLIIF